MKRILTLLAVSFCALFIAVSCGSKKTPVDELIGFLDQQNSIEQKFSADKIDWDEYQKQSDELKDKAMKFLEENKTYELTDADRDKIYDFAKKTAAAEGHEITSEEESMVKTMLNQIKTLEDFGKMNF